MLRSAVRNLSKPKDTEPVSVRVQWYVDQGYRVVSQTDAGVQLVKPKQFSFVWALLWFLCLGVGLVVYLLYYAGKKDQSVFIPSGSGP